MGSGGRLLAGRTEGGSFGEGFVDVMAEHRETLMTATHGMSEGRSTGERRDEGSAYLPTGVSG